MHLIVYHFATPVLVAIGVACASTLRTNNSEQFGLVFFIALLWSLAISYLAWAFGDIAGATAIIAQVFAAILLSWMIRPILR